VQRERVTHFPVTPTNPVSDQITTVRTNVAKSESMPAKPSLAKIAGAAANLLTEGPVKTSHMLMPCRRPHWPLTKPEA